MLKESASRNAIVLLKSHQEESFLKYQVLTAEDGILHCMQRISKKKTSQSADLFDFLDLTIDINNNGTSFIKEFNQLKHFDGIAGNYKKLSFASEWSLFLINNLPLHESGSAIFLLSYKIFNALHLYDQVDTVAIKAYYTFAKAEGYPVKEQWYPSLKSDEKEGLRNILASPIESFSTQNSNCKNIYLKLKAWLDAETDLII